MATEIERKFLVVNDSYRRMAQKHYEITQGYLSIYPHPTVRVRTKDKKGYLTVKSRNHGVARHEWEYEIPYSDACEMLQLCHAESLIEKTRYIVGPWEVDEFHGRLDGLVVAEIELKSENQQFDCPSFIGLEVSDDPRYYNSSLSASGAKL